MGNYYGEKIPYDPLWQGPIKVKRRKTDPHALNFYLTSLIIWIVITIFVSSSKIWLNEKEKTVKNHNHTNIYNEIINGSTSYTKAEIFTSVFRWLFHNLIYFPAALYFILINGHWGAILSIVTFSTLTALLSMQYLIWMRYSAKFIAWLSIVLLCFILFCMVIFCFAIQTTVSKIAGGVIMIIMFVVMWLALEYRKKIAISAEIVKEATKTVLSSPYHFWLPFIEFLLSFTALLIFANNIRLLIKISERTTWRMDRSIFFFSLMHIGNFVGWIWTYYFINGVKYMTLSGSYATWYWTMDKSKVPDNSIQCSAATVRKYHLGTVAAGSIFMSICDIINGILETARQQARDNGSANRGAIIVECFTCCCQELISTIMLVTRNGYVMCALHGTDFYSSGKNAFNLIMRNIVKVVVTTQISSLLFTVGVVLVISGSMLLSSVILMVLSRFFDYFEKPFWQDNDHVHTLLFFATVIIVAMLISSIFDVLKAGIETFFICCMEDLERNFGDKARPYYMSPKLRKLLLNEGSPI